MAAEAKQQPALYPLRGVAATIAEQLNETEEHARKQIARICWALGDDQARQLLNRTFEIEAEGGRYIKDGSRRKTPGGVFFDLAYSEGKPLEGKKLYRPVYKKPASTKQPAPALPTFVWEDRGAMIEELKQQKGIASTVKITLVGKMGKWQNKGQFIAAVMQSTKVPALPKGIPTPPATNTPYVLFIGAKQWRNIEAAASDQDDSLIIEGYPQIDTRTGAINVFVTNATSKKLQAAKPRKDS
ncbi:MAG: hypothetical protein J2P37_00125 [Ktedonobacteraceae bacterium]|nr:hypothetical protein [Ktedonobacteraceae bacterium]